jgi:septum formation protein
MSSDTRPALILGSSSPYRRELLSRLRIPFEVATPDIDETPLADERPAATALRLSRLKAEAIAARHAGALVIGSDQVCTLDDQQIGKPGTHAKALAQLQLMRGRTVTFHSALCLLDGRTGEAQVADIQTRATFRDLSDAELDAYLRLETPYDCAGSAKGRRTGHHAARARRIRRSDRADRPAADRAHRDAASRRLSMLRSLTDGR